jgi:hypothetical protein
MKTTKYLLAFLVTGVIVACGGGSGSTSSGGSGSTSTTGTIFFSAQSDSPLGGGIYSVKPDGTGLTNRFALNSGQWNCFAVSTDSSKLYTMTTLETTNYVITSLQSGANLGVAVIPGTVRSSNPWLDSTHLLTWGNTPTTFYIHDLANNNGVTQSSQGTNWGQAIIDSTHFAHGVLDGTATGSMYIHDVTMNSSSKVYSGVRIWPLSYDPKSNYLYCQLGDTDTTLQVAKIRPDGGGLQVLTSDLAGISFAPAVSPDGTKIAFINSSSSSFWTSGSYAIYTMNNDGTSKTKILEGANLLGTGFTLHSPLVWAK